MEEHFTHLGWKYRGLAKKSALLTEAQRLIYLILHIWYESYSSVLVTLHTKANLFERQEHV